MQGAVLYGPRDIRFEERETPKIVEPTDAVIRIAVRREEEEPPRVIAYPTHPDRTTAAAMPRTTTFRGVFLSAARTRAFFSCLRAASSVPPAALPHALQ